MQADALQPLNSGPIGSEEDEDDGRPLRMGTSVDPEGKDHAETVAVWPEETLLQVGAYLRLGVSRFPYSWRPRLRFVTTSRCLSYPWQCPIQTCHSRLYFRSLSASG
jgi:hypothetical protein